MQHWMMEPDMEDMPTLETARLTIRPFTMADFQDAHRLFDIELSSKDIHTEELDTIDDREQWLQWLVLNYVQLAKLNQPPYGDRAIILKSDGSLIGSCGYVPCLNPFEQMPNFGYYNPSCRQGRNTAEVGLFYAISPTHQRKGYASEAAQALVDYGFQRLNLRRIIAATDDDNSASIGVMRKLGMVIERNPENEPPWLQVVGVIERTNQVIDEYR
jgi:ribosomal-protein-alanine N-acetyltransferase